MYKKILAVLMVIATVFSLTACAASFATQTFNLDNDDSLTISFKTDKYNWDMEFENNLLSLWDDDEQIYECAFQDEDSMEKYVDVINNALETGAQNIELEDDGQEGNIKYVLLSFEKDDETVYEIVGWVVGSNTGIVADVYGDEDLAEYILETLKFKVKKTEQGDSDYYFDVIDDIED